MTGTKQLDEFVSTLNDLIESALSRVQDPDAFFEANNKIHTLIETALPPLAEALKDGELCADARDRLKASLASIQKLEGEARARLVWSRDFEDYMREALSTDG